MRYNNSFSWRCSAKLIWPVVFAVFVLTAVACGTTTLPSIQDDAGVATAGSAELTAPQAAGQSSGCVGCHTSSDKVKSSAAPPAPVAKSAEQSGEG